MATSRLLLPGLGGGRFDLGAYSDEFNDAATLAARWSALGTPGFGGGPVDINTTKPFAAYVRHGGMWEAAPATPFEIIAKLVDLVWDDNVPSVGNSSIAIASTIGAGPYYFAGIDVGNPGQMGLASSRFDASGNFVDNPHFTNTISGTGYVGPALMKMVHNSPTSTDFYMSFDDGLTWLTIFTGYNFGIAPNYLGLSDGGSAGTWAWVKVRQL